MCPKSIRLEILWLRIKGKEKREFNLLLLIHLITQKLISSAKGEKIKKLIYLIAESFMAPEPISNTNPTVKIIKNIIATAKP